jgi:hypothetical protein
MAKPKKQGKGSQAESVRRAKLTPEESLKRMQEFPKRKEPIIAAIRKGKDRGLSA